MLRILLVLLVTLAVPSFAPAQSYIWVEAESAKADAVFQAAGWGHLEYLSAGKWLFAAVDDKDVPKKVPDGGLTLAYDLPVEQFGKFEVWARVGYEFARAPFRWRIDGGNWADVKPEQFTTDLMCLADFAEVAWLKLGDANLAAGTRKLEINVPRPAKGRLLFGLDCVLASRAPFVPNGPHKPDADWQTPADKDAADVTFEFPRPATDTAARRTVNLGGTWQVARFDEPGDVVDRAGPIAELPDLTKLHWKAIRVPANKDTERPELAYCHRLLYRCRVSVPADLGGRAFVLRFPNNALLTTVFVNGKQVGFSDTPCAAFECDITPAVQPGKPNEIVVGIKDLYYALAKADTGKSCRFLFNYPTERFMSQGGLGPTRFADFPVLFQVHRSGILETPTLSATGPAYAADVFAMPSVKDKELTLETTAFNATDKPVAVEVRHAVFPADVERGDPALTFPPERFDLAARTAITQKAKQSWSNPKLWWPDDPSQYVVETTTLLAGNPVDRRRTKFGFREWGWAGRQFTLNGVPWQLRADLRHNDREAAKRPLEAIKEWRRNGQNMFRYWGEQPWTGRSQGETLEFFDFAGVPVRRTGTFDGEVASYALVIDGKPHAALFDNWRKQLAAWVRAERNHPSVFIWSLENEVTYINARNFGLLKQVEPEIKKAAELVMGIDPTRPVMVDGGDALMDQSLPVAGNHYLERDKRDYPDEAYTLALAYARHAQPRPWDPWPIPKDKPLFLGESFFANGSPPSAYAEISGETAFLGRREAVAGVAKFARMLSEGYRWHGVAAFHFWFAEGPDAEHYKAWQPVCVLCREWDTAFAAGSKTPRTLKVFNDTRFDSPVTVHWLFQTKNTSDIKQIRGKRTFNLKPGASDEFSIMLDVPAVTRRTDAELVLSCERDGVEVFRDVRACRALPVPAGKVTTAAADEVALWDPAGKVKELVGGLTASTEVASPGELPATCKLLIVGPDAITAKDATDPKWTALAAKGVRVLAFEQQYPLHYLATPADLEPTTHTGRIAFPENPQHPAFAGLSREDFFCWAGDHVVYRNAYRKPSRGARSLAQCDVELSNSALVEVPVGDGLLLLSQLDVGSKPGTIVARTVAANLIRYAWEYKRVAKPTTVVLPDDARLKLLAAAGLKFTTPAADPLAALSTGEIVVLDATPKALKELAAEPDKVKAFTEKGGNLVLWGVTPDGLADFDRLVGFDHVMRPFKMERVSLPGVRPPLLAGLSLRDVALESAEKIYPWSGDRYPANDTFTNVVDLGDIAPFVKSEKYAHAWSQMTNGLTSADSWKFIFYHDQAQAGEHPSWEAKLPHTEEVTGLSVVINAHYRKITKLRVVFDGDREGTLTLTLKPEAELRQDFDFPPRKCRSIALEPEEWAEGSKPVLGIDNLWLRVKRPDDFKDRVVPLLNIGALVYYPNGKGGMLLNQVRVNPTEANPENAGKKQTLVATLLRNLGAEFAAERLLIPGANLAYDPVPLGEKCNAFLSSDKGWIAGQPDLSFFPVGEQTFAGVRYDIRDFKTSPLPAAIMLAGPGTKVEQQEVGGLPVGKRADALYFLHTFHKVKDWRPPQPWEANKPKDPPAVFRYVVHYADGTTADVPVRLGIGVGHWISDAPAGLPAASVAWAAAFPKGQPGKQAVVYAMPWTNPKPDVAISAVDVCYDPAAGNQYGVPVVFGITAATERK